MGVWLPAKLAGTIGPCENNCGMKNVHGRNTTLALPMSRYHHAAIIDCLATDRDRNFKLEAGRGMTSTSLSVRVTCVPGCLRASQ